MHTINIKGLGGWDVYGARDGSGACAAVNARDLGLTARDSIAETFSPIRKNHPGYDPVCDCYCWGYKPEPVQIMGLPRGTHTGGLGALEAGWKVCNSQGYSSGSRCPCANTPQPRACPTCPPAPPPPPCPVAPPPVVMAPAPAEPQAFGVTVGLVAAAALTGGVGYYGYKKGWFKRKR
jgi:hypothetical protein